MLGNALGMGISKNFEPPEQRVQRGVLAKAFEDLQGAEKGDYLGQLKAIAPTLMTAPGGAELLNTLAPLLRQQAQNDAMLKGIENQFGGYANPEAGKAAGIKGLPNEENIQKTPEQKVENTKDKFRERPVASGPGSGQHPQRSAGPEVTRLPSPQQIEEEIARLVQSTGGSTGQAEARQLINEKYRNILNNNNQIVEEQQREANKIKESSSGVVEWAKNSGLIKEEFPEEQTVIEQLAYEFRDEKTPADQREKVREAFKPFAKARESLRREGALPGGFSKFGRMITGNYQDKESVLKKIQPQLEEYRKYGLYDEARDLLVNDLGLGREDAESALFPLKDEAKKSLSKIPKNKITPKLGSEQPFPGSGFDLPADKYERFKDELGDILNKNPGANLLSIRGDLNQNKKYSWQDISKATNELIAEKRFTPDQIQQGELAELSKAPLPGLAQQFAFWWRDTK